ncbi:hypothetical protein B5G43_00695 [Flavonifractor sp. An92]|nr:hypothetical protein B5G43_00695 [Flavonifractor sp. An92]
MSGNKQRKPLLRNTAQPRRHQACGAVLLHSSRTLPVHPEPGMRRIPPGPEIGWFRLQSLACKAIIIPSISDANQAYFCVIVTARIHLEGCEPMTEPKELPACPVETTLMLIGDKWKVLILRGLIPGTKRFGELKKSIVGRHFPKA